MLYNIEEITFDSSNNKNLIYGKIFIPKSDIKGIIQISHGMCEYIDRYDAFADFFCKKGYVVCGHSHIGHGKSVLSEAEYGFFSEKDGYKFLIEDVHKLTLIIKQRFPNKLHFLLGHSMGSFILRCYLSKYGREINGAIIVGTAGSHQLLDAGISFVNTIIKTKGQMYRSRKLNELAFKVFNEQFSPSKTKYDWVSSNVEFCKRCEEDKMANFIFTASGFKDLFMLLKICNSEECYNKVPINLPVYILSGAQDPVGENGIGPARVYANYYAAGLRNLSFKIYKDKRHEILNETDNEETYNDIINWLEGPLFRKH